MRLIEKILNDLSAQGLSHHLRLANRLYESSSVLTVRLSDGYLIARVKDEDARIFSVQANLRQWQAGDYRCDCHQIMPCAHLLAGMQAWLAKQNKTAEPLNQGLSQVLWRSDDAKTDDAKWEFNLSGNLEQGYELDLHLDFADGVWHLSDILLFLLNNYSYSALMEKDDALIFEIVNAQGAHLKVDWQKIKWLIRLLVEGQLQFKSKQLKLGWDWSNIQKIHAWQTGFAAENQIWQSNSAWKSMQWLLTPLNARALELSDFKASLRPYQEEGVRWLLNLFHAGFGGILADDMGLGKTIQILAYLSHLKASQALDHPALIVMPTSLLSNWLDECQKYSPHLQVCVYHGSKRDHRLWSTHDIILSSYGMLQRDFKVFQAQNFSHVILDEAQLIKNFRSQKTQALKALPARIKIGLTGTPMENHYGELWSLVDFALSGLLGTHGQFKKNFQIPLEKFQDREVLQNLKQRLSPFVLRRSKQTVLDHLPPKNRIIQKVQLSSDQIELYESLRAILAQKVQFALTDQGLLQSRWMILDALLKLRQICCDPRLLPAEWRPKQNYHSAKLEFLMSMLANILAEDRSVLVFSQFTSMLNIIAEALEGQNIPYLMLTGKTKNRAEVIRSFQEGKAPIFLLSMKVGGLGLNLTKADTVIHYEPWWNPAVTAQATDRIHRLGQTQAVFEYHLIAEASIEAKMMDIQAQKQELLNQTFAEGRLQSFEWTEEAIMQFFAPISDL
jgi:superfamily II DNA or RNA helicase